jgi:hypothetical protein
MMRGPHPATDSATTRGAVGIKPMTPLPVIVSTGTIAIVCLVIVATGWNHWASILLLLVPILSAWAVRRASILVTFYVAQIAVFYGLTCLVLGQDRPPILIVVVAIWTVGLAVGGFVGRSRIASRNDRRWSPPRWPQFVLMAGLLVVQTSLLFSGLLGYGAQLTLGLNNPTDVQGILATAAPIVSLMLLITAGLRAQRLHCRRNGHR